MFEEYYGLSEKPFAVQPNPSFLFLSEKHKRALARLRYSMLNHAGLTLITGEIGSGKTTLVRELIRGLESNISVGLVSNVNFSSFTELMQWILYSFELDYEGKDKVALFETFTDFVIQNYSDDQRTVLIIDEAQNLDAESLEQLRMLLNINVDQHQVLQLILVGQPGLLTTLQRHDLEQLVQRIEVDYVLQPLDLNETKQYIQHRIKVAGGSEDLFLPDTYPLIWRSTSGIPRLINILCGMAIVYGYADFKDNIDCDVINHVLQDKKSGLSGMDMDGVQGVSDMSSYIREVSTTNDEFQYPSTSEKSAYKKMDKKERENLSTIEKMFLQNGKE